MKKFITTLLCLMSALMVMTHVPAQAASYENIPIKVTYLEEEAKEHLRLLNEERKKVGASALKMDADLMEAAMLRAAESVVYFSHERPDGTMCYTASDKMYGENIAWGQSSAQQAITSFVNSQGHYKNMITPGYTCVGIGAVEDAAGIRHWVQCFGYEKNVNVQKTYKEPYTKKVSVKALAKQTTYKFSLDRYDSPEIYGGEKNQSYLWGQYGTSIEFPVDMSGFTFKSSDTKKAYINTKGAILGLRAGSVTITAKGLGKTFTKKTKVVGDVHVTFEVNGGTLDKYTARDYNVIFTPKAPSKAGYVFKGWYLDEGFTEKAPTYLWKDTKVYAKWTKIKFSQPKTPTLAITAAKNLKIKMTKVTYADGYQIYSATNSSFKNAQKKLVEKTSVGVRKATKGKTYYVKYRPYRIDSTGKRVYGPFSKVAKIKA